MNPELIERVMSCRDLPSLPAVAVRVVELTNSDRVNMRDLAEAIQNDQALAAKVLRTVNSSLFGLRTKCANINQAIVMLGLSSVKSLALGFTLVGAIRDKVGNGINLEDHWRRALYTGVAARLIAQRARAPDPEEAFLGGLLQDVGMVALSQTLGRTYHDIVTRASGNHRSVCKFELEALQTQHPDVGAMLAKRWKLPDQLVMPIKYHERATAAPVEHSLICRAVGLGNLAADVLTATDPSEHLRKFYQRAEQWFTMRPLEADELFNTIGLQVREVAKLLSLPAGQPVDAQRVISAARERLTAIQPDQDAGDDRGGSVADAPGVDELTGLSDRVRLEQMLVVAFEQAQQGIAPMSMALLEIDRLEDIAKRCGADALDALVISAASRLQRIFSPAGGTLSRYDLRTFAVLLPKCERAAAVRLCDQARRAIVTEPIKLIAAAPGSPPEVALGVSIGLATIEPALAKRFESLQDFTRIVEQATAAARKAGSSAVRVYAPQPLAA